jgi:hypothetical protein
MAGKRKPVGWPKYMEARASMGVVRYYWNAPSWARKRSYHVKSEPLGADYAAAKSRCDDVLNPMFESWRTGGATDVDDAARRVVVGSFDWLCGCYKKSPRYTKLPARTRESYDRMLRRVADYVLNNGRRLGSLAVRSLNPAAVDLLHEKLKIGTGGKALRRTPGLAIVVCKTAWDVARRANSSIIPADNPFSKVDLGYRPKTTRAATKTELEIFVAAADGDRRASLGTAAMIAYYWLQREEDIFMRCAWSDYRPADNPDRVMIWHHKNHDERIPLPLFDVDGSELWPEMTQRLAGARRLGTLIVMRDAPDPRRKINLPWMTGGRNPMRYVQAEVRRICRAAGLPDEISFTSFRHGGHTDGAESDLTEAQMRALGGHKTTAALYRYAKETEAQRQIAGRKRRDNRTNKGNLSE